MGPPRLASAILQDKGGSLRSTIRRTNQTVSKPCAGRKSGTLLGAVNEPSHKSIRLKQPHAHGRYDASQEVRHSVIACELGMMNLAPGG